MYERKYSCLGGNTEKAKPFQFWWKLKKKYEKEITKTIYYKLKLIEEVRSMARSLANPC